MGLVANFICFSAVKIFWKLVKIWQSYRKFKGGNFFQHSVEALRMYKGLPSIPLRSLIHHKLCCEYAEPFYQDHEKLLSTSSMWLLILIICSWQMEWNASKPPKLNDVNILKNALYLMKQEGHAVTGNYRAMRNTCTKSLYLILGQQSE